MSLILLLYTRTIQHYLSLFGCKWRHILLLGPRLSMARAIKWNLKAAEIIQPIIYSQNQVTS